MNCVLCLIENDPIAIFGLKKMLEKTNYVKQLEVYEDGEQALHKLKPHLVENTPRTPDVIFLDLNMPIMDGWEFIEAYTAIDRPQNAKKILLYVVTSSVMQRDRDRACELSAVTGYIVKPVTKDDLKHVFEEDLQELWNNQ